jgi:CoA:oxalate CoA-transferase
MTYPLESIRVLDLSRVLAGPYAGRMLTDLGAEVVKVEPPGGDISRIWGMNRAGITSYYLAQNIGKRSVCVDLGKPGGPEFVRSLAERADVIIENFRPGVLSQFGLDYAALSERNPRAIMLSISGFGQAGPESQRPAYAAVLHAESGILARQAEEHRQKAVDLPMSVADMNAGLHGLVGILSALVMRDRTGRGQHIDLGMLDAMLASDDYIHFAADGLAFASNHSNEVFDVVGGGLIISGDMRWIWHQLHNECGLADPAPGALPVKEKIKRRREAVLAFFGSFQDRTELQRQLDKANLAWGDVKSSAEALAGPSVAARGIVVDVDDRAGGTRRVVRSPYRFSHAESGVRGVAAHCGEHNREVARDWLAMPEAEIERLTSAGVLLRETPAPATPAR